jgi:hypothetical protein
MKTLYLLYAVVCCGNAQAVALDHFETMAACDATRTVLLQATEDWWEGHLKDKYTVCLRVEYQPKEGD